MAHRQRNTAKPSKDERALAKLERRLADARLEVDRRARQLARANADVADLEARRAALLEARPGAAEPVPAAQSATPARTGRPTTRSRARRSPRSGTTGGTAGGG
jgi:hypothetical protein